jgi:hypothetical protein
MSTTKNDIIEGALEILRDPERCTRGGMSRRSEGRYCAAGALLESALNLGVDLDHHVDRAVINRAVLAFMSGNRERTVEILEEAFE